MGRIIGVEPKDNWHLEIRLDTGSTLLLNLAPRLHTVRFGRLADERFFRTATTDGTFIRWGANIEISLHEAFLLAEA